MKIPKLVRDSRNRISKREFIMVTVLVVLIELYFLFYQVLVPKFNDFMIDNQKNDTLQISVERLKADYDKMDEYKQKLSAAAAALDEKKKEIPAYLAQEEMILLLNGYAETSKLTVGVIDFDSVETVQESAYFSDTGEKSSTAKKNEESSAKKDETTAEAVGYLIADQRVALSFTGSYNSIYAFLKTLEDSERKAYAKSLTISSDDEGIISGSMTLSFISHIDSANIEQFKMDLDAISGKTAPFKPYNGYISSLGSKTQAETTPMVTPDFTLYINSYLDNAAKVILGNYSNSQSQLSADENKIVNCRISFTKESDGYRYSLTLGGRTYNSSSSLKVKDGEIILEVVSQSRRDSKDLVGVTLDVSNSAGVPVRVVVSKDDAKNPRFKLGAVSGEVSLG